MRTRLVRKIYPFAYARSSSGNVYLTAGVPLAASAAVFCTQPHVNSFTKKRNSVPTDLQSRQYCYLRTQRTYRYLVFIICDYNHMILSTLKLFYSLFTNPCLVSRHSIMSAGKPNFLLANSLGFPIT